MKSDVIEVTHHAEESQIKNSELFKKDAPELLERVDALQRLQSQLDVMKVVRKCVSLMDIISLSLHGNDFTCLHDKYSVLMSVQFEYKQFETEVQSTFTSRLQSFDEFILAELRSKLLAIWTKIRFPFEEIVDYRSIKQELEQTVEILRCIQLILSNSSDGSSSSVLPIIFEEFGKRFNFHFYGDKPTNSKSKPEWFYSQLSMWLSSNLEFFESYLHPLSNKAESKINVVKEFQCYLMNLAIQKLQSLIAQETILQDKRLLSHLIDETVIFEKEMLEAYDYPEDAPHVITELCRDELLDIWIKLERDTISVGVDHILSDELAYESRYKDANDVDSHLVPNFADAFVILMDSMTERYRSIPDLRIQQRFVKLQLIIVDEFRSRIVQIGQEIESPWKSPFPQLMNALRYMTEVLDEWSGNPEFLRLQGKLMESSSTPFIRRTFDDSRALYEHVWRQKARLLTDTFNDLITLKLDAYSNVKWFQINIIKPIEISPAFTHFLHEIKHRLSYILTKFSSDPMLTLEHSTNNAIWATLEKTIILQTSFNYRGAEQMYYDITTGLIPLLNSLYKRPNFNVILNEKCVEVLNEMRLLKLPSPTAILLKDDLQRIPDQMLEEKLSPFEITGLSRQKLAKLAPNNQEKFTYATGSVTLIKAIGKNILVDCGDPYNGNEVIEELRSEGLTPSDITHLVITHWHIDHCANINYFSNASLISNNSHFDWFREIEAIELAPLVYVIKTPGHTSEDVSVVVEQHIDGQLRFIAVVGDLFENEEDFLIEDLWKINGEFPGTQNRSRAHILRFSDFIIPGHGPGFENPRSRAERLINLTFPSKSESEIHPIEIPYGNQEERWKLYLIIGRNARILINTGPAQIKELLIKELLAKNVNVDEISHLIITSSGVNFCGNLNLFKNAQIVMDSDLCLPGSFYDKTEKSFKISDDMIAYKFVLRAKNRWVVLVNDIHSGFVLITESADLVGCVPNFSEPGPHFALENALLADYFLYLDSVKHMLFLK
uniref:Metallo-beta-lactamase domain-containing protein n=1 Tax=Acrobeloides nanus TaxID=290746 RepID=A0A914CCS2_9BILA